MSGCVKVWLPISWPSRIYALQQADVVLRLLADHHEGALDVYWLQDVENLRRPFGIGPVVKGERDLVRVVAVVLDGVRLRVGLMCSSRRGLVRRASMSMVREPGCGRR